MKKLLTILLLLVLGISSNAQLRQPIYRNDEPKVLYTTSESRIFGSVIIIGAMTLVTYGVFTKNETLSKGAGMTLLMSFPVVILHLCHDDIKVKPRHRKYKYY